MSFVIAGLPGDKELLDYSNIQKAAGGNANAAYIEKYGICKSRDPEWKIGGERHEFWLSVFDQTWTSAIVNPHQE